MRLGEWKILILALPWLIPLMIIGVRGEPAP